MVLQINKSTLPSSNIGHKFKKKKKKFIQHTKKNIYIKNPRDTTLLDEAKNPRDTTLLDEAMSCYFLREMHNAMTHIVKIIL